MKSAYRVLAPFTFLISVCSTVALDTNRIAQITGLPGTWIAAEEVFKVTAPRNDLPVSVDGWRMPPFMGLTTWAGFVEGRTAEAMNGSAPGVPPSWTSARPLNSPLAMCPAR